jgi:hypothetical protein
MHGKKAIKIDFYLVKQPDDGKPFEKILTSIFQINWRKRACQIGDHFVRLNKLSRGNQLFDGEFSKLRMTELPEKGSLLTEDEMLDFANEEGLSEKRAFLYDPKLQCLAIQRNRQSATLTDLSSYMLEKSNEEIDFDPLLSVSTYQRLAKMDEIRKFELSVAGINNSRIFEDLGLESKAFLSLNKDFQAPMLKITLSMGRQKGGMLRNIIKAAKELGSLGKETGTVNVVKLQGIDEDGQRDLIDLLNEPLMEEVKLDKARSRSLPYTARLSAVHAAYRKKRDEIATILKTE